MNENHEKLKRQLISLLKAEREYYQKAVIDLLNSGERIRMLESFIADLTVIEEKENTNE